MIEFRHTGINQKLARRRLLCTDVHDFLRLSLSRSGFRSKEDWQVELGDTLLFDHAGLKQLALAISGYGGQAKQLHFCLKLSPEALRDYYSHSSQVKAGTVLLPVEARRADCSGTDLPETLELSLPELATTINFPLALTPPDCNRTPLALLMPYGCDHDLLFANQIAIIANIAEQVQHSPASWLRALFARRRGPLRQRIPLYWNSIHPSARIHPTAVVEGSVIGPECRIGALCVVRYSILGSQVQLHDGAKVEYSAVDDRSWLMHDLVLYRSVAETDVFLIHGPYQFSCFQHASAAFATIMMDYRPDSRAISINTPDGVRPYHGRFLGALLEENARVFGGTLTAPGITIPAGQEVYANIDVVRAKDLLQTAGKSTA
jgi:hypothetical protein